MVSANESSVDLAGVEELLGVRFVDAHLGRIALSPWIRGFSRLEFLGDAIMGLAVISAAEVAGVARETALQRTANEHLDGLFREHLASHTRANTGDVIEAIIGAVYLDGGYDAAARVARSLCLPEVSLDELDAASRTSSLSQRGVAFIGAAVLSASAADDLCIKHPTQPHRWLSEERSRLLSRRRLAVVSADLGYAPVGDVDDDAYRAGASDALEAVLGDQYLRWGWEDARSSSMRIIHLAASNDAP